MTERDHCTLRGTVLKNHRTTTAQVTAELNIHLAYPVSTKSIRCELHKSSNHGRTATAKPLITESNTQMCKQWCPVKTIKPGHETTENTCVIWSDELAFMLFPTSGRVYVWRTPEKAYNMECLIPIVKHGRGSAMVWPAILCTAFCWPYYYPSWPNYCNGIHGQVG
jgi:hypothetical protein